ncbi:MAG TPA: imidazole glycerol phosphate synthase subunit HisH [Methylophilus sp.]|nr:imidazole glycerol phosphate synthase subunit HisH [Methylophilus sp.]HQQ33330.1 imidazole glycerol phosphate synthase subunit HisH [Methylophilus sp.]
MRVAIINYNMGNLGSVRRSFEEVGAEVIIASHPSALYEANRIVLPGVGAFPEGMAQLNQGGWVDAIKDVVQHQNKPLLGICLGMQMLASRGFEGAETAGLDLIPGTVRRIDQLGCDQRVPHMGWNAVHYRYAEHALFQHIPNGSDFYFVHSYALDPDNAEDLLATTTYGCELTAIVAKGNVLGCQFHPEKSSKAGRQLLKNFMAYPSC